MERVIAVIGPTAVGKTRVSIDLAKLLETEVISGDSMLVYKRMNIGTAKPTLQERAGIVHHLIDYIEPVETFSVTDFQQIAAQYITGINRRGKIPILAGGTGLYVRALLENYQFNETPGDSEFRQHLEKMAEQYGNDHLHAMLARSDSQAALRLHPNDRRRIIRALEVRELGGESISQTKEKPELVYESVVIGLTMERAKLYQNINLRVDQMMAAGLEKEVAELLCSGVSPDCQSMKGIGYKEMVAYLQGRMDLPSTVNQIKQATRNFAKRQLTWYRRMPYIQWFSVDEYDSYEKMMETIYKCIAGKFCLK
ncbi:tRNA (adenosine(37)-N6)-dimethylallyltransferase MiaA [Propionispora hippei]|uniref:tRNA dimethylallyltransferase n=1 Tax=Propionispora hippei DSM 15287 TaxID=1123003 RepID=A0A1M6APQ8_9FIRM|nr:tRNA (adenosine(37)-N6)-dimethylallyltransferase MiaA [Propionispora hippei]SHI38466.1 tRNA dimethylallyltransferase [Propionispora hippei DSM 15287]